MLLLFINDCVFLFLFDYSGGIIDFGIIINWIQIIVCILVCEKFCEVISYLIFEFDFYFLDISFYFIIVS